MRLKELLEASPRPQKFSACIPTIFTVLSAIWSYDRW